MDIPLEAIRARTSVRTYDETPLSSADREALLRAFRDCLPGPFGGRPRFVLTDAGALGSGGRIGTYGVIRGAPAYIAGAVQPGPFAFVDFGYCLEGVILAAAARSLGTCWLGGFFDRGAASRVLDLGPGEVVPAATPAGRPAEGRRSLMERVIRGSAGASRRKPFESLFFDGRFDRPLSPGEAGPWAEVLECVRIGPSASNKQPWRILRTPSKESFDFHLFLDEDRLYSRAIPGVLLQDMDMGIAMRHFEAAARALGLPGGWSRAETSPPVPKTAFKYISTWK
jgi:nitroreductase